MLFCVLCIFETSLTFIRLGTLQYIQEQGLLKRKNGKHCDEVVMNMSFGNKRLELYGHVTWTSLHVGFSQLDK